MKYALLASACLAALAFGSQRASAQQVFVPATPGVAIGGTVIGPGFAVGGVYSPGPAVGPIVAGPRLYAAPVVIPAPPVAAIYPYRYGHGRHYPYYPPRGYYHRHHRGR